MKDHDKYLYVEIALPKDNPAVQHMVAHADKSAIPLRVLIKSAAILAYSEEESSAGVIPPAKSPKKTGRKRVTKDMGIVVTDAARDAANSLLDDMGFE